MQSTSAESVRVAYPLFQAEGGGSSPTSALQLFFREVTLPTAKALNALWHSRLPRYGSPQCRIAYAAEYAGLFFAVAIWQRPLARRLPQYTWMELSRLAIAPDAPRNSASRMLAWMCRDVRRRFPEIEMAISYQDTEAHTGTIYRAAGWTATALGEGGEWSRPSRPTRKVQSAALKQRWEKKLCRS
jgi:hypothetical protein